MIIILDTGVVGYLVHTKRENREKIKAILASFKDETTALVIPEIADYELRRALIKVNSQNSLKRLDSLAETIHYASINTGHLRRAAEIWAECRIKGHPFCDDSRLDGDCILIAQTEVWGAEAIVLTTNVKDIGRFVKVAEFVR